MKTLVAYFSAEGTTAAVAKALAEAAGADIFEIKPEVPYTAEDVNYRKPFARCNKEWFKKLEVPAAGNVPDFDQYELVLIGFPIWYGCAPLVVSSFCKGCDWSGKKVAAFATSGGSGIGKTAEKLRPFISGGSLIDAKLVHSGAEVSDWAKGL